MGQLYLLTFERVRRCLVNVFKQQFSVFKQHFTYFHILFHPHVFSQKLLNNDFQFLNTCIKRVLNHCVLDDGTGRSVGANVGHVAPESGKDYCAPMWEVGSMVGELCIKLCTKIVSPEFFLFSFLFSLICVSYCERVTLHPCEKWGLWWANCA